MLATLFAVFGADLRGQDQAEKDRFLSRKKWYGSFTFSLKGNGEATRTAGRLQYRTQWRFLREVTGVFELDEVGQHRPKRSKTTQGEKAAGRFISWDAATALSPVVYRVNDRISFEAIQVGEIAAETVSKGCTRLAGTGVTQIGRKKELYADLKDLVFDLDLDDLQRWNRDPDAKPLTLSGEYHDFTAGTGVRKDRRYDLARFGIRGILPDITPLLSQLMSRKLELGKEELVVTASMPVTAFPLIPPHPGDVAGGRERYNEYSTVGGQPLTLSLHVLLSPTPPSTARLLLKPPPDYETAWRPECTSSETVPGNRCTVQWRIEEQGGDPGRPTGVKRLAFVLNNTSKETGVCMNRPQRPVEAPDFDLKIPASRNPDPDYHLSLDGQAVVMRGAWVAQRKGEVAVDAYDSGASCVLVASAELEDGRMLTGIVEGSGAEEMPIPDHEPGIFTMARWWMHDVAKDRMEDVDDENTPVGDGQRGDGLNVWQEYRGFWVGGQREGGDPMTKDLFIRNEAGILAQGGITLFGKTTGLLIHDELDQADLREDRVINGNKGSKPHLVDQHALRLSSKWTFLRFNGVLCAVSLSAAVAGAAYPGPPKNSYEVRILPTVLQYQGAEEQESNGVRFDIARADRTVAHELGHALGIHHHGESETVHKLVWVKKASGEIVTTLDGQTITVEDEDGRPMIGDSLFPGTRSGDERQIWVGEPGGQSSGDELCFMRYVTAEAYRLRTNRNRLCYHGGPEVLGNKLCKGQEGTGVNLPSRTPQPRYFNAQGGDCCKHFVVSDHWERAK